MGFQLETTLDLLERTPALLSSWLRGLSGDLLAANEGPDTFSPHDVVSHLLQGEEEDWVPRMRIILEHGEARAFTPFERFAFRERHAGASTAALLERFAGLRRANLAEVRALELGTRELARTGIHPELGRVTLRELLATWVVHDQAHVAQIARVLTKHLGQHAGAWRAYFSMLAPGER